MVMLSAVRGSQTCPNSAATDSRMRGPWRQALDLFPAPMICLQQGVGKVADEKHVSTIERIAGQAIHFSCFFHLFECVLSCFNGYKNDCTSFNYCN